jgi:hypothetical protein
VWVWAQHLAPRSSCTRRSARKGTEYDARRYTLANGVSDARCPTPKNDATEVQSVAPSCDLVHENIMGRISFVLAVVVLAHGCASSGAGTQAVSPAQAAEPLATHDAQPGKNPIEAQGGETSSSELEHEATDGVAAETSTLVAAMPTACTTGKDCVPPREFAEATCRGRYPSMAIAMFEKHSPWQRLYLKAVTLESVNAYGDRSTASPMVFGEEVLVLRGVSQPRAGNLQVSSSDIDVLRWDGTCATVARELFSTTRMPNVVQAAISWRFLEDPFQQALLSSKYVAMTYERYRATCKGSSATGTNSQCQRATEKLNEAISVAVRGGLALPTPAKLPTWAMPDQANALSTLAMVRTRPR